jgi:excisionase family DNA binding protein
MNLEDLNEKLERLEYLLKNQYILNKTVLTSDEACEYIGCSKSHLYKLTSGKHIPCYCPEGKKLYFKRTELDVWMLRNRQSTQEELDQIAINYVLEKKAPFATLAKRAR